MGWWRWLPNEQLLLLLSAVTSTYIAATIARTALKETVRPSRAFSSRNHIAQKNTELQNKRNGSLSAILAISEASGSAYARGKVATGQVRLGETVKDLTENWWNSPANEHRSLGFTVKASFRLSRVSSTYTSTRVFLKLLLLAVSVARQSIAQESVCQLSKAWKLCGTHGKNKGWTDNGSLPLSQFR